MKRLFSIMGVLVLLIIFGCAQTTTEVQKERPMTTVQQTGRAEQLYTAYNIWITRAHNMNCINYKYGNRILPAGTMVRDASITRDEQLMRSQISFQPTVGRRWFNIKFTREWHPGKTIEDYKNYMFSNRNFEALTAGLSEQEIAAIRSGTVVNGMSKRAVLISYGYPPQHKTPALGSRTWTYWRSKFATFDVCFDENERTTDCP